jgi:hypothetical protein
VTVYTVTHVNFVDGSIGVAVFGTLDGARAEVWEQTAAHGGEDAPEDGFPGQSRSEDWGDDVTVILHDECRVELRAHDDSLLGVLGGKEAS